MHKEVTRLYLFDLVTGKNGKLYGVSTVPLPKGGYHTATFPSDENGVPTTEHPIREHVGSDWTMAQRIHSDHIKLASK